MAGIPAHSFDRHQQSMTVVPPLNRQRTTIPFNGLVFLADVSGSMRELMPDGKTRHQGLRDALKDVFQLGSRLICFSDVPKDVVSPDQLLHPGGNGTLFGPAIKRASFPSPSHMILITDGQAQDGMNAIHEANKLTCKISALYLGEEGDIHAIDLLKKICLPRSGQVTVCDVRKLLPYGNTKAISKAVRGLLA